MNIDKIGEKVKDGVAGVTAATEKLRPMMQQVWAALEAGQTVNGCTKKEEWAAWSGQTTRNIQHVLKGKRDRRAEVKKRTSGSSNIGVALQGFTLEKDYAWVSLEIEAKSELPYLGKRRNNNDYSHGNPTEDPTAEWIHVIKDVHGSIDITVESEDGSLDTDKKLVAALYEKMVATLKSMRLWRDSLKPEFEEYVQETIERDEHKKEERSQKAKKAAVKRKKSDGSGTKKETRALIKMQKEAQANWDTFDKGEKSAKEFRAVTDELIEDEKRGSYGLSTSATKRKAEEINQRVIVAIRDHEQLYTLQTMATEAKVEGEPMLPSTAKTLAAAVDGAVVPKICETEESL